MSSLFAVSDTVLLHRRFRLRWVRHNSAARFVSALLRTVSAKINCTKRLIRRCRALQHAKELRDTVMSRLLEVADLCSRTVSDTANMSRHGSTLCSPTVEKILCRSPYFAAVTCRQSAPDYPRERGDSQEGGNRRCLPSCAPARRQRKSPAAGRGTFPPP